MIKTGFISITDLRISFCCSALYHSAAGIEIKWFFI
jgi:hypothetical protein